MPERSGGCSGPCSPGRGGGRADGRRGTRGVWWGLAVAVAALWVGCAAAETLNDTSAVVLGGLFPVYTRTVGVQRQFAAELAVQTVNSRTDILPHNTLFLLPSDTYQNPVRFVSRGVAVLPVRCVTK